ncbi:nitroreductase/quinone reductase family protein [Tenggerimyces flavus]|uniref:Nitroreductase/quinone reductase family protein n=1 Tax=Tenggerimyces flavus TaxID=1708749 RepID=A0ABV7YBE2_9ACTN|nr:nitroreductase/quinone reductase family protein [Tenggerimyces flavus]MBM7783476.1 deazaflavin-dependent oxidoreductase (nitroreductase family) [Tenggerimyces flavus]
MTTIRTATRSGTRGARITWAHLLVAKLFRKALIRSHRKKGDTFLGQPVLYLTTKGAKSGTVRVTPVGYVLDGPNAWLVVASLGGAARNPAWYYNVVAHPDALSIEVAGKRYDVTAEQLTGDRRAEAWDRITAERPSMAEYQTQTDRILPVLRLTAA